MVAAEIEVFGKSKFKSQHHGYDQLERKSIRQTHDEEIQEDVNGPIDCKMFCGIAILFMFLMDPFSVETIDAIKNRTI